MSNRRVYEGGKRRRHQPYVAMVEGSEGGVAFRVFYKRIDTARSVAERTRGTMTDLRDLSRWRSVRGEWTRA